MGFLLWIIITILSPVVGFWLAIGWFILIAISEYSN
jgi:hypothetical protein